MKLLALTNSQLLTAFCLFSGLQHANAKDKKDSKDDASTTIDLSMVLGASPGCGSTAGCAVATGEQVVSVDGDGFTLGSRSAFGQLTYEFDPGFTQMKYSTRVYDPENQDSTMDVDEAQLVCLFAGEEEVITAGIIIATLTVSPSGALTEDQLLTESSFLNPIICNGISITTIAALYESMISGDIAALFTVQDKFAVDTTIIRAQIFVPQKYY
jgi:hypothetical protein